MLKDPRAKRAWTLYFLKAEAVLSPLNADVRKELIADLKAHVDDILANEPTEGDELARLSAALTRVGDPREFLAPLLADAVFKAPPRPPSAAMAYRTLTLYAARGGAYLLRTLGLLLAAMAGLISGLAALNSLLRPAHAGLFRMGSDEYQLRIMGFGEGGGAQLLEPWMAALVIALGAVILWWSAQRTRRILMELIASA